MQQPAPCAGDLRGEGDLPADVDWPSEWDGWCKFNQPAVQRLECDADGQWRRLYDLPESHVRHGDCRRRDEHDRDTDAVGRLWGAAYGDLHGGWGSCIQLGPDGESGVEGARGG